MALIADSTLSKEIATYAHLGHRHTRTLILAKPQEALASAVELTVYLSQVC